MDFDANDFEAREANSLRFDSENGFKLRFTRWADDPSKVLLYQEVYNEDLYIMELTRAEFVDFIYKLETLLDD